MIPLLRSAILFGLLACLFLGEASALASSRVPCLLTLSHGASFAQAHFAAAARAPIPFSELPVTPASLYAAHRTGYLPERGGVWEVPDPRGTIDLKTATLSRKKKREAARLLERAAGLRITFNGDPSRVIAACAGMGRASEPWMTDEIVEGYQHLARVGLVFSVELWDGDANLVAGNFGMASGGHVQGVSMFRDLDHPLAKEGVGNLVADATFDYFRRRGVEILDVEVAIIKGGKIKQGVDAMPDAQFLELLAKQNTSRISFFDGAIEGKPLPLVESDFLIPLRTP